MLCRGTSIYVGSALNVTGDNKISRTCWAPPSPLFSAGNEVTSNPAPIIVSSSARSLVWMPMSSGLVETFASPPERTEVTEIGNTLPEEISLWTVPYARNPHFTGRDDLLQQLGQVFSAENPGQPLSIQQAALTQTQAITGLGGIERRRSLSNMPIAHARKALSPHHLDLCWKLRDDSDQLRRTRPSVYANACGAGGDESAQHRCCTLALVRTIYAALATYF